MASNTIKLEVSVDDKGTLRLVQQNAKAATKAVNQVSDSTDRASKSRNHHNKLEKGAAQLTNNSTKAFAKQAQTIGSGLVPAYATLAANIFAITAAFGALQRASQLEQLREGLEFTGNAAGVNLGKVAARLREITGEAVSAREAMSTVALGTSAGFSTEQLEGLTRVAKGASLALGRDMEDAMSRLSRGAAKLEPEILDELGIMVRLDDATESYATQLGKTANELTQFERRQAFVNAIITQGEKKFGELADNVDANPYDRLAATFKSLATEGLTLINKVLGPLVSFLAKSPAGLTAVLTLFGATVLRKMIPSLENMTSAARNAVEASRDLSAQQLKNIATMSGVSKTVKDYQVKLAAGTAGQKDLDRAIKGANLSYETNVNHLKTLVTTESIHIGKIARKVVLINNSAKAVNALARATFEQQQAQAALNAVNGIQLIQGGHLIKGGQVYIQVLKAQVAATQQAVAASTVLGKVSVAAAGSLRILGTTAQFVGAAFSRMLPVIGQIIFAYSLLQQFVFPLFRKEVSATDRALEDAEEQSKQFAKTQEQLANSLKRVGEDALTSYTTTLRALAGEARESADAISDVVDGIISDTRDRLEKAAREGGLFDKFVRLLTNVGAARRGLQVQLPEVEISENRVLDSLVGGEDKSAAIKVAQERVDSLSKSIKLLRETGSISENTLSRLENTLASSVSSIDSFKSNTEATVRDLLGFEKGSENTAIQLGAMLSVMEGVSDQAAEVKKLFNELEKPAGPLADRIKLLEGLGNSLSTNADVVLDPEFVDALNKFGIDPNNVNNSISSLKALNDALVSTKLRSEEAKVAAENLRAKGDVTSAIEAEKVLQASYKETIAVQERFLQQQILSYDERIEAETTIAKARQALAKSQQNEVKIRVQEEIKIAQRIMDQIELAKVLLETQKEMREELQKRAELTLQIAKSEAEIRGLGNVSRLDELRLQREAAELKIKAAKDNLMFIKAGVQLEIELEKSKLALMEAQFRLKGDITKEERAVLAAQLAVIDAQSRLLGQRETTAELEITAAEKALEAIKASGIGSVGTSGGGAVGALVDRELLNIANKDQGQAAAAAFDDATLIAKIQVVRNQFQGLLEDAKKLGPEGELVASIGEGALQVAESFATAFQIIDSGGSKLVATLSVVSATVNNLASIQQAQSQAAIASIDREIEAEKRRDGKSAESTAKIIALEKKKEAAAKKAFERDKKMKMAQTVINTSAAIVNALATSGNPFIGIAMAAVMAAMGAAQLAIISGTTYQGGSAGSGDSGPSSVSVGQRNNVVDLATARNPAGEIGYMRGEQGSGSGATNFTPAFAGTQLRAPGGKVGVMTGEQGPELFIPEVPGKIIPADETANIGSNLNVNFSIHAIDSQGMKDALTSQRGNIIRMIREAANAQGEFFLENVTEFDRNLGAVA